MKLFRNKINLLVSIASLVSIGIITFISLYFSSSVEKIKRAYAGSQVSQLQNQLILNSASTNKALIYLAGNNDMRPCVVEKGGLPADIGQRLSMAGFSFLVVTTPKLAAVAYYPQSQTEVVRMIPADRHVFSKSLSDGRITTYYQWKADSLFEIAAITIPGCSGLRSDSIGSWLFAGRYISNELTEKVILQLPGTITLQNPPTASGIDLDDASGSFRFTIPLYGWDNTPKAALSLETRPEIMQVMVSHQRTLMTILIGMAALFMIFIYVYLNRYYILPLKLVSLALKQKDPEYIRMISDTDPDLNSLQSMLMNVFNQERMLSDMIKRRSADQMDSFHAAILSKINEAVYATDHKGIITYWNKAAEDLYGTPEPEAISKISQVLIKTRWKSEADEQEQLDSLNTSGVWQGRIVQEIPDGSEINVEVTISCLYDTNNSLLGHLTIVRKPYQPD